MSSLLSYKNSYSSTTSNHSSKSQHSNMDNNKSHDFYYKNAIIMEEEEQHHPILNHKLPASAKDRLEGLLRQVDDNDLSIMLQGEYKTMLVDQQRLVTMLEQRVQMLENENDEFKIIIQENQKRYEKAVREMQFFKKKFESFKQQQQVEGGQQQQQQQQAVATTATTIQQQQNFATTPSGTPQQPAAALKLSSAASMTESSSSSVYSHHHSNSNHYNNNNWPPNSPTISMAPSIQSHELPQQHTTLPTLPNLPPQRPRTNSSAAASLYSVMSGGSTESNYRYDEKRQVVAPLPPPPMNNNNYHFQRNPSMTSSYSSPSSSVAPSMMSGASSIISSAGPPPPMTPVRSCTSSYTGHSMIQQRRTDPLTFGGSDALWDTISKSSGSDVTVEKIISNFLRRGGSPNTAKQSPSSHAVKYGYGMIHALIVTKAPGSLDLLLQQGANPNAVSISQVDEDKVSPCYLAASVGWLTGLENIVQAGGDLMSARGAGNKKKTALHVAAENGHIAVVEYIVSMTQGVLNLETDSIGANTLHYACVSGDTELISFVIQECQTPLDEADERGEYPIHWAVRHGKQKVVTLLVEHYGCDVNVYTTKKVGTPYDVAKSAGFKKMAEYLKSKGGLTAKKMDKKKEEEAPRFLESVLAKNGLMDFGF